VTRSNRVDVVEARPASTSASATTPLELACATAISGTTPPKRGRSTWLDTTLDRMSTVVDHGRRGLVAARLDARTAVTAGAAPARRWSVDRSALDASRRVCSGVSMCAPT
jgi:hypothetical protein